MSKFDGSKDPLTYGQALVELAGRASWPSEEHAREVTDAIRAEHGLELPEPDAPLYTDPRDATLVAQTAELQKLREEAAARAVADQLAAQAAEIDALKAAASTDAGKAKVTK